MPDCAVVALDVGVLLRFAGLDVLDGNPMFLSPYQQLATDVFRPLWCLLFTFLQTKSSFLRLG